MVEEPNQDRQAGRNTRRDEIFLRLGIGLVIFIVVIVIVLWLIVRPESTREQIAFIQTASGIFGGSLLLFGLFFTWRGQMLTEESTQETLRLAEEGQVTERFMRAIDQLGATNDRNDKNMVIRCGAVYALERIARNSLGHKSLDQEYATVVEVLTAYLRENSPWPPINAPAVESDQNVDVGHLPTPNTQPHPADIKAILRALRRLLNRNQVDWEDLARVNLRVDFSGIDLRGALLPDINVPAGYFENTNLAGAVLLRADLRGGIFSGAYLRGARLHDANLEHSQLRREQIDYALGNENTKLPKALTQPVAWSKPISWQIERIEKG